MFYLETRFQEDVFDDPRGRPPQGREWGLSVASGRPAVAFSVEAGDEGAGAIAGRLEAELAGFWPALGGLSEAQGEQEQRFEVGNTKSENIVGSEVGIKNVGNKKCENYK